jgi:hypothetical protein
MMGCVNIIRTMTDNTIDILPSIPDRNLWDVCQDRCDTYWRTRRSWIIFGCVLTVLSAVVITIVILQPKSSSYPCLIYGPNSLASTVSVECLQYTWNSLCLPTHPYTFPQGYTGWWRSSPQGSIMVPCSLSPGNCGVGSYGNIMIYMQTCTIQLNQ